jgi:hypothetical protein
MDVLHRQQSSYGWLGLFKLRFLPGILNYVVPLLIISPVCPISNPNRENRIFFFTIQKSAMMYITVNNQLHDHGYEYKMNNLMISHSLSDSVKYIIHPSHPIAIVVMRICCCCTKIPNKLKYILLAKN